MRGIVSFFVQWFFFFRKRLSLSIIFCCIILINCQENEVGKFDENIVKAKAWFEKNEDLLKRSATGRTSSSHTFDKQPDWSKSIVHHTNNGYTAVEVGLEYETYLVVSESELMPSSEKPNVINSMVLLKLHQENMHLIYLKFSPKIPKPH